MSAWSILWSAVKSFLGWLFFSAIFVLVAGYTGGWQAYLPLESFVWGSAAVFLLTLGLGVAMEAWRER